MKNYWLLIAFMVGYELVHFQKFINMYSEWDGVYYYAEIHMSVWNRYVHTIFMPGTMLGFFILVPSLLNMKWRRANNLKAIVAMFYVGLYWRISALITVLFVVWYAVPFYYSGKLYKRVLMRINRIITGLIVAASCLLIQEYFGHYIGGDKPSRFEGVANAILYAPFSSVGNIFTKLL